MNIQPRIVNADNLYADPKQFPGLVQLRLAGSPSSPFCGGVKIGRGVVVTAAHCVDNLRPSRLRLLMNLSQSSPYGYSPQTSTLVPVQSIVIHPSYDRNNIRNDIALISFRPTADTDRQSTATLPPPSSENEMTRIGAPAVIAGYGRMGMTGGVSKYLHSAEIRVMDILTESQYNPIHKFPGNILAGDYEDPLNPNDNQDSCQGDSGGPLYARNQQGQLQLIGLTSWGNGCALDHFPGFYTNVFAYLAWIQRFVRRDNGERRALSRL